MAVDDGRVAGDGFKLSAAPRALVAARLADVKTKDAATLITEGGRAGASLVVRGALDTLSVLLHDGYNFLNALPSYTISKADKLAVFTSYGWLQGEIGGLDDARIESLANQALTATPLITTPAYRYPTALLDLISDQLDLVNANQPTATGGAAEAATSQRNVALELLRTANGRVRFFYCSASDDEDQTTELARIGKQPRRDAGAAEAQPFPDAPGTATFDAAAKTLAIPALPTHATSLRAFRKPAGGVAELAGTSTGTTVSVTAMGPLSPGVTYELWVVGHNFRGDGPASNHVSHTG